MTIRITFQLFDSKQSRTYRISTHKIEADNLIDSLLLNNCNFTVEYIPVK